MKRQFVFVALLATILTSAFAKDRKVEIVSEALVGGAPLYFATVDFTDLGMGIVHYKFFKDKDVVGGDVEGLRKSFEDQGFIFYLNTRLDPAIQRFMKEQGVSLMLIAGNDATFVHVEAANYYSRKTGKFYYAIAPDEQ